MGATMNILLAVLVMAGLYMHGIPAMKYDDEPAVVGSVQKDSPAERAGLMPRDRILEVGETPTPTWSDFRVTVALNPGRTLPFRIVRDGEERTVMVSIGQTQRDAVGRVGVSPYLGRILVTSVKPGGPAEEAGLRKDDEIASVAGLDPGLRLEEALSALSAGGGEPVALVLRRGDATIEAALRPREEAEGRFSPGFEIYPETVIKKYGFAQAVQESLRYNWRNSDLLFRTIRGLATRSLSIKTLSGPIEIFKLSGEAWKSGAVGFFIFMAMVSLQLGIINLLPIPVLDGGHIFILMVEGVMRRDLSNAVKERLIQAGLVLLVLLMGTVLYFDVYKNWLFKS
jgi:regulator of sigma E protease